ncbi:hypothetical protein NDI35_19540 [Microcoleus vaginatus FACHB-2002]
MNLYPFSLVGWRETGFLRQFLVEYEDIGRNPVFGIHCVARNRISATISG